MKRIRNAFAQVPRQSAVQTLYEEFLGKPLGEKSHKLLHTHYQAREKF